ncbi:MAG: C40 family peptidase [Lachnospiraceae bacterium]|nr:C40 family peptidase [Lachnospiraceae bacterium]
MNRKFLVFFTLIVAFLTVTCMPLQANAAGKVALNKSKLVLEMGTTETLKVKNTKKNVKWSTSDKKIVKVNKGVLKPVSVGTATITAKVSGKSYTCKVTVADYSGMSIEQKQVVSFALKYVGNKYRYGGTSLTNGTDCSGFTYSVYRNFGYEMKRTAYQQLCDTKSVKKKNLKPGDLIFYGSSKTSCSHVALYIGNKKVVHASTESTGIVVSDYDYRKAIGYGRVLKKATYPGEDVNESVTAYAKGK